MKKKYYLYIFSFVLLIFSSCATIFYGKSGIVNFNSTPQGASVTINGKTDTSLVTPCKVDIRKGNYVGKTNFRKAFNPKEHVVNYTIENEGNKIEDKYVPKTKSEIFLSFFSAGLIGLYVDSYTNSCIDYSNNISVDFDKNLRQAKSDYYFCSNNNGFYVYNAPENRREENYNNKQDQKKVEIENEEVKFVSDVDINIHTNKQKENRYALIIGNENYFEAGGIQSNVDYALRDARTFKQYAINTFGIPENNIIYLENATRTMMKVNIDNFLKLMTIAPKNKEFYIYYAGHGLPSKNADAYLMPVDIKADYIEDGIKLSELYKKIVSYETKRTVVFIDACFSGGGRNKQIVKSRSGIKLTPNKALLNNNLLIFAATSEVQVAKANEEQKHGMFSYYLFKNLQESKGKISFSKFTEKVIEEVATNSVIMNKYEQTPQINVSKNIEEKWKNWKVIDK